MGRLAPILLALSAASYISTAQAWTLAWRKPGGKAAIATGVEPQPCRAINHSEGLLFEWNAKGGPWCIKFYTDPDCNSDVVGTACDPPWNQNASQDLSAFEVYDNSTSTTATSTASPTPSSSSATNSADSGSGGGSSLSGGAIAGIVIGVVVAVAIIGALAFFLGMRRRRKNEPPANPEQNNNAPPSEPPGKSADGQTNGLGPVTRERGTASSPCAGLSIRGTCWRYHGY